MYRKLKDNIWLWLGSYWENIEPVEEYNGEGQDKMGASPESRAYDHKSGEIDLREDR